MFNSDYLVYLHPYALLDAFSNSESSLDAFDVLEECLDHDKLFVGEKSLDVFFRSQEFALKSADNDPTFWKIVDRINASTRQPGTDCDDDLKDQILRLQNDELSSMADIIAEDLRLLDPPKVLGLPVINSWLKNSVDISLSSRVYVESVSEFSSVNLIRKYVECVGVDSFDNIDKFRGDMFPNLVFNGDWLSGVNTLVGDRSELARKTYDHLRVLNDVMYDIWGSSTSQLRQDTAAANNVILSPEGPNTHKNKSAMRDHEFNSPKGVLVCEWHTKLHPTCNRIYFCWTSEYIFIAVLVRHLRI